jgi:uncharacterized protein (TIGR03083 family)
VRDLIVHVVSTGDAFLLSAERGVAGSIEQGPVKRRHEERMDELADGSSNEIVAGLERGSAATGTLYERLSADELEAICYHRCRAGVNGTARWNLKHRLVEVAYHGWDLERSVGRDAAIPDAVASFLLPTLLKDHLPTIYEEEPGGDGRYCLTVSNDPAARWVLSAGPERLLVSRDGRDADVTVAAPASVLALLIYGRANLMEEERHGRARIDGDRALAERFQSVIPPP